MRTATDWMDPAAIVLSGLCLAHCLALPALSIALPFLGLWAKAEWVHLAVIGCATPLALLALKGRRARRFLPLAVAGLVAMGVAVVAPVAPRIELGLNVVGGLALATAHTLNLRQRYH